MDDDLDVAGALAVVFETVRAGNASLDAGEEAEHLVAAFDEMMDVLGIAETGDIEEVDVSSIAEELGASGADVDALVELRERARSERDWERADAIRDALAGAGVVIEDTPDGARWHRG